MLSAGVASAFIDPLCRATPKDTCAGKQRLLRSNSMGVTTQLSPNAVLEELGCSESIPAFGGCSRPGECERGVQHGTSVLYF